jgi:S-formylglutathione hydrolase FrmB
MQTRFGVSPHGANWGIVGFSMGGTCAVDLTVMHPELFSSFVDIGGDRRPTAGTREQTIARLFAGNAAAFDAFDPGTVISRHGVYRGISGWFAVSAATSADETSTPPGAEAQAARTLCALGKANGITCTVTAYTGKHNWPFAADTFAVALPWLAGQISTPAVRRELLPRQTFEDAAHSAATGER